MLYHYYGPLWKKLFTLLGFEVVLSDNTHKSQIEKGIKVTVAEICVPIKIFNGHVLDLMEKDVDLIFIPRFVSIEENYWFCPKFMGLPELAAYSVPGSKARILTIDIRSRSEDAVDYSCYKSLCRLPGVTPKKLKSSLKEAALYWKRFRDICRMGYTVDEAQKLCDGGLDTPPAVSNPEKRVTLGILGYVYNVYDPFVSLDIVTKLRSMGVRVITFEMLDENVIRSHRREKDKALYWTFSDKLAGAGETFIARDDVDGMIHVTAFGCGPDSIIGKFLELDSEERHKPMMTLRIDEHTGESHLQTRLEAFVDMIARKKQQDGGRTA